MAGFVRLKHLHNKANSIQWCCEQGSAEEVQRRAGARLLGAQCALELRPLFIGNLAANGATAPSMRRRPALAKGFDLGTRESAAVASVPVDPFVRYREHSVPG
jgi:hypothetical protein